MATSKPPVMPTKQAVVNIAGYAVVAVLFADNSIGAVIRMICDLLGVDHRTQIRKVRADPAIYDSLILAMVDSAGGPHETNVIIAEAIPIWLAHIHKSKVAPEARETLIEFQRVAVQTLRAFFFSDKQEPPPAAPPTPVPAPAPPPQAAPAPDQGLLSVFDLHRALVDRMEQEHLKLVERLTRLEGSVTMLDRQHQEDVAWLAEAHHHMQLEREQVEVLWSVVLGRASAPEDALSAEQQHALELLLRYHQRVTGQPRAAIEREVLGLVGVAEARHLRQEDWKAILAWFRQRMGR